MNDAEFNDARIVEIYDLQCPWGPDDDYFRRAATDGPGSRVLDLGCGTGRLTIALGQDGLEVTGIDPAAASLDAARAKPGADRVTWVEGTSNAAPSAAFDTIVMTSHVAQFFVGDAAWTELLTDLRRILVPGGRLVFDTRDPEARAWDRWNPAETSHEITIASGETVAVWTEVPLVDESDPDHIVVSFRHHYEFADGELVSDSTLEFRTEAAIRQSLMAAGFDIHQMLGGWNHEPVGQGDGELLVVATHR